MEGRERREIKKGWGGGGGGEGKKQREGRNGWERPCNNKLTNKFIPQVASLLQVFAAL